MLTSLIHHFNRVCPLKIRSTKEKIKKRSSTMSTQESEPLPQRRAETLDLTVRQREFATERVRIFHNRLSVISTYNSIISVQRTGHRMQKTQLIKYLSNFYCELLVEQMCKIFRFPDTLTQSTYEQIVNQIHCLDKQQYLNYCFQLYDINQQGVITSTNLLNILTNEKNSSVEKDILIMIDRKHSTLKKQLETSTSSALPQLKTFIIRNKPIKKKMMISQISDMNQIVVQPINRLRLLDKQQFCKLWSENIPEILKDLFSHLNDY